MKYWVDNLMATNRMTINASLQRQYQLQHRFSRNRKKASATGSLLGAGLALMLLLAGILWVLVSKTNKKQLQPLATTSTSAPEYIGSKVSPQIILSRHEMAATQFFHSNSTDAAPTRTGTATQINIVRTTSSAWIGDYWMANSNNNTNDYKNKNILLWTCAGGGCGGIGDRLFGILQAFCMAVCLKREFLIDWDDTENVQFPHSSLGSFQAPDQLFAALDDRSNPLLTHLEGISGQPSRKEGDSQVHVLGIKTNLWMGAEVIRQYDCWDPSFALDDHEILQTILVHLVQVTPSVKDLAVSIQRASRLPQNGPYIAVHLRTGILDQNNNKNHFTTAANFKNWTAVVECAMQFCSRKNPNVRLPVYVATDDEHLKQQLARQFQLEPQFHANTVLNDTTAGMTHYADTQDTTSRKLAWAEWYILTQAACVLPTHQSKYSQSASIYTGCSIDTCNNQRFPSSLSSSAIHSSPSSQSLQSSVSSPRVEVCNSLPT